MKKLIILAAFTFAAAAGVNAQPDQPLAINDPNVKVNKNSNDLPEHKMDKREVRKELRKINNYEVSYFSKAQFYVDFGNLPGVKWERRDNFDEATFMQDGKKYTAFYDNDASLVGTISASKFTDLPLKDREYINKKYPDYKIKKVIFYDDNELNSNDMILYNQEFNDPDSYFVELQNGNKKIVLQAPTDGGVYFFKQLNK